jgi:hypothetical protein
MTHKHAYSILVCVHHNTVDVITKTNVTTFIEKYT